MTVCIAAICSYGAWPNIGYMVVGASDRMLSGEDIQFEPPQTKIYTFPPLPGVAAIALVAGDPYAQMSVCVAAADFLRYAKKPPTTIREVAEVYAEKFSEHRRKIAETAILKPHGLDANSLMDRQQDFRSEVVADLMQRMEHHKLGVETIVTGVDSTGAHIFIITDPGQIECADSVAFASIGTGKQHADSQFMMARHTREVSWTQALLSTYVAKKRAEVSPTVGRLSTDLFFVGAPGTGYQPVSYEIHERIRSIYEGMEGRIKVETDLAMIAANTALTEIVSKPPPEPQAQPPQPPPPAQDAAIAGPDFSDLATPVEAKEKPKKQRPRKKRST